MTGNGMPDIAAFYALIRQTNPHLPPPESVDVSEPVRIEFQPNHLPVMVVRVRISLPDIGLGNEIYSVYDNPEMSEDEQPEEPEEDA